MNQNFNGWIDVPVIDAIEYFSGILSTFFGLAVHYAQFIGLVGLCWSAFKLANSRFTIRDFWWDTLYKWLLFLLMMNLYVPVTAGIAYIGNKIGIEAGNAKDTIILSLENMKTSIQKDLDLEKRWEEELSVELKSNFDNLELPTIEQNQNYTDYINSVYDSIGTTKFNSSQEKKKAKAIVDEYKNRKTGQSIYGAKTLKALDEILIERKIDGTKGDSLLDSYVDLDIWLYDRNGDRTNYLSCGSLLRLTTLCCQILWEKNQLRLTTDLASIEEDKDIKFMKQTYAKLESTIHHIPKTIMTMIICIALIVCIIFSDIQYLMCILEFTIVVGIGAFFIPFILFDGTKELPKKIVPVFTGYMIKLIVMNIIIFFIFNELIVNTIKTISGSGEMSWVDFAGNIFFCFISFVLSSNGPKIAMTILTGQPQLSMGEFVQMAGSVAAASIGAGKVAGKVATGTAKAGKEGVRKTAQGIVNTHGNISKLKSAATSASDSVKELGGTNAQARKAAAKGVFATASADLKDKFHNAGNNFLHGDGKKGNSGAGSGGHGSQAHQRNGQNSSRDLPQGASRTLSDTSNPTFKNATRYDEATGQNVNMTRNEFYAEKRSQGKNIGMDVALDLMEKAKDKNQVQKKDSSLGESLTGGERASK